MKQLSLALLYLNLRVRMKACQAADLSVNSKFI